MTVQNVIVKNIARGNGVNKKWPYTFACPANHPEFIKVYIRNSAGKLSETKDFTVDTATKYVTYPVNGSVLGNGEKIVIARELPLHQDLNLVNQGPFFAEDLEVTYDEIVMMIQQLNERLGRVLTVSVDVDSAKDIDLTVPLEAKYGWRVSDDGKSIVLLSNPETVYDQTVNVYDKAVADTENIKAQTQALYNQAVADTTDIKNATEKLRGETLDIKNQAVAETTAIKNEAQEISDNSQQYANLARAWAESPTAPDGIVGSKSSKTWAEQTSSYLDEALNMKHYAETLAQQIPVWNASTAYAVGDIVMISDGSVYRCLQYNAGEFPTESYKWVKTYAVTNDTFELDSYGDLNVALPATSSEQWEIDANGDVMVRVR